MARATLWIEFPSGQECAWEQDLNVDFERFEVDEIYAHRVSTHIAMTLGHLASEVKALAVNTPIHILEKDNPCE